MIFHFAERLKTQDVSKIAGLSCLSFEVNIIYIFVQFFDQYENHYDYRFKKNTL